MEEHRHLPDPALWMLRHLSFHPKFVFESIDELHQRSSAEPVVVAPDISEYRFVFAPERPEQQDAELPAVIWQLLVLSRQLPESVDQLP